MTVRKAAQGDLAAIMALWQQCCALGEIVHKPLTEERYRKLFAENIHYTGEYDFAAEEDGRVLGFVTGCEKRVFLPKETRENTPGYLTMLLVAPEARGKGVAKALLGALEDAFRANGKKTVELSNNNPVNLPWFIPDTAGHDHNNAPGVDTACAGHGFLLHEGYREIHREMAMYLDLARYRKSPEIETLRSRLAEEGITVGRYDCAEKCEFDTMCDRVGSEYWRKVLQDETAKEHPRVILAGRTNGHIVGFTGPVDLEESGRGWFTGICVDPVYERRGIATVLFNDLMGEFVREGAAFSTLFTGVTNHAQKIYLRAGFTVKRTFAAMQKTL